jgi:LysM domain
MTLDIQNQIHAGRIVGRTVLIIGNECANWTPADFAYAARVVRGLGVDTIAAKRVDGTVRRYGTRQSLLAEIDAVHAAGCGYLPWSYHYGPRFGLDFVAQECAVLTEMQETTAERQPDGIGFACADLEVEWNGRTDAAARFNAAMQNKHMLYLTSWANPGSQAWLGVLNVLRGCINAYVPQAYTDYLNTEEYQQLSPDLCIQTAVDLSQEFGPNHPVQNAQVAVNHGQTSIWMWEWSMLGAQRANAQGVVQVAKMSQLPSTQTPVPSPPAQHTYIVQPGDNLSAIASKLGIADWHTLYDENRAMIGDNPNLIHPGQILMY